MVGAGGTCAFQVPQWAPSLLFLPSLLSSPFLFLPPAFSLYRDTILHTIEWPHLEAVTDGYACAATVLIRIQDISITSGSLLCPCAGSTPVPGTHWPVTLGEFAWFTISYKTHSTYLSHLVSCSPWYFCGSFTLHLSMALAFWTPRSFPLGVLMSCMQMCSRESGLWSVTRIGCL